LESPRLDNNPVKTGFSDALESADICRLRACYGDHRTFARVSEHRCRQPFSGNALSKHYCGESKSLMSKTAGLRRRPLLSRHAARIDFAGLGLGPACLSPAEKCVGPLSTLSPEGMEGTPCAAASRCEARRYPQGPLSFPHGGRLKRRDKALRAPAFGALVDVMYKARLVRFGA
jgi:hypothetical protein